MNTVRIELEQGYHALAMLENANKSTAQIWACVYDSFGRPVKDTAGWYPTAKLDVIDLFIRDVMAFNRHNINDARRYISMMHRSAF